METKVAHHPRHILVGIISLTSAAITVVGVIALFTYLNFDYFHNHMINQVTIRPSHKQSPKGQPPLSLAISPTIEPNSPDAHLLPPIVNGMVPVISDLPTTKPVVFLTIDDGAHKSPDELPAIIDNHLRATLFLARLFVHDNPGFFADFANAGNVIENHTLDHHTNMTDMSYDDQKAQICGMADYEQQQYGRRPVLFRPPGGAYNDTMRRAAADCGMHALITWIAKANGGSMQYQIGNHLRAGDIVLMHFRPEFQDDLRAFVDAMNSQHLHTELLENWLQ